MNYDAVIVAPFGRVGIVLHGDALSDVSFLSWSTKLVAPRTHAARRVCAQLRAYFKNPRFRFNVPLVTTGTPFQRQVWRVMQQIPPGKPLSYGAVAKKIKSGARAVGNACRRNPMPLVVPCHRIVATAGDGGFMGKRGGHALVIKRWLLAHERGG